MACPPHPLGVKPYGQLYLEGTPDIRAAGLGRLAALSDELLLAVLYALPAAALQRLGAASKALYAFAHYDEIWKALTFEEVEGGIQSWHGSWRETFLVHTQRGYTPGRHRPLTVKGLYSDLLHQPWLCASLDMLPEWLEVENVDRRSSLSVAAFQAEYEAPNRPVILTDVAAGWPARTRWTREYLLQAFAGREVIVGNAPMRLAPYLQYADANADEMPLYMFDKLAADYAVPPHFADDLFSVLGEEERPDYRWLIIGPKGSGSSFHVDPNATSAWNAVVSGAKKWILYPPGCTPPGVHVSADGADVAAPVSLMEWFLNYYGAEYSGGGGGGSGSGSDDEGGGEGPAARLGGGVRAGRGAATGGGARKPVVGAVRGSGAGGGAASSIKPRRARPLECVVRAGELLFVPRGWFHTVVNLEEGVAVTQNFVSELNLDAVLLFLRTGAGVPGLVSGTEHREDLYSRFVARLRERRPEVWAAHEAREAARRERAEREGRLGRIFREEAAAAAGGGGGGVGGGGGKGGAASSPPAAGAPAAAAGGGSGFSFGFKF